ncbi:hypothetical protein XbrCFBP1976_15830 [Xanthomonas bromi]|uniref:Uncharacterized protein n=1 Tax=Xanthomonas bromi TaxID=56449 RepID=A0ABX5BQN8_9XANT|nr:hypothetical protein XbrCFBP1976_15830 [Xanthomonas bromi]
MQRCKTTALVPFRHDSYTAPLAELRTAAFACDLGCTADVAHFTDLRHTPSNAMATRRCGSLQRF